MAYFSFKKTREEIEKGLAELAHHSPSPLIRAVLEDTRPGDSTDLENLLKEGKTAEEMRQLANTCTEFGDSLLMLAVYKGYYEKVKLLIRYGADINHKNTEKVTALLALHLDNSFCSINFNTTCELLIKLGENSIYKDGTDVFHQVFQLYELDKNVLFCLITLLDILKENGIQLLEKVQPSIKMLDGLIRTLKERYTLIHEQASIQKLISWAKSRALEKGFINKLISLSEIEFDRKKIIHEYEQAQEKLVLEKGKLLARLESPNSLQEFEYNFFELTPRFEFFEPCTYLDPQYRTELMPIFIKLFKNRDNPHNKVKKLTVDIGSFEELTAVFEGGNSTIQVLEFVSCSKQYSLSIFEQVAQRMAKFFELIKDSQTKHDLQTIIFTKMDFEEDGKDSHFIEPISKLQINSVIFNDCLLSVEFGKLIKEVHSKEIHIDLPIASEIIYFCQGLKENKSIQKVVLNIDLPRFYDNFDDVDLYELFFDFIDSIKALFNHNNTLKHLMFLEKSDAPDYEKDHVFPYFEMRLSELIAEIEPAKLEGEKPRITKEYKKRVKEKSQKILSALKESLQDNTTLAGFRCPFDFSFVDPKAIVETFDSNVSLVECQLVNGNHQAFQSEGLTEILQRNRIFQPILNLFNQLLGKTPIEARFDHPEASAQVARVRGLDEDEDGDVEMKVASEQDKEDRGKESKEDRESKTSKETKDGKEAKETQEGKDHEESKKAHEKIIPEEIKQKIIDEIIKLAQGLTDPNRFEIFYIIAQRFFLDKFFDPKHAGMFFTLIPRGHTFYSSAQYELAQIAEGSTQKLIHLLESRATSSVIEEGREIARLAASKITPSLTNGGRVSMEVDPPCLNLASSSDIGFFVAFTAEKTKALDCEQKKNKELLDILARIETLAKQGSSLESQKLLAILNEQGGRKRKAPEGQDSLDGGPDSSKKQKLV